MKEKNDLITSGPPSAENGYDHSPHYVTMPYHISSSSSPRRMSYFQYDRDEEEFLNSYSYDPNTNFQPQTSSLASMMGFRSASSSTTTNTSSSQINNNSQSSTLSQPPASSSQNNNIIMNNNNNSTNTPTATSSSSTTNSSNTTNTNPTTNNNNNNNNNNSQPLFYHQQNYMYPPYANSNYYPNMLGITACSGANDTHRHHDHHRHHHSSTSVGSFSTPPQQSSHSVGVDLLDHHHQEDHQPSYFNANPLVAYANPISDPAAAAAAAVAFGSGDL
jgi:hypothetical protein